MLPRPHYVAVRVERFGRRAIAYDVGRARCERVDRLAVQMVVVRVGYQNQIGFGQSCVIGIGVYGVDVDRPALACRDGECGVFEKRECQFPTVACDDGIGRVGGDSRTAMSEKGE